MTRQQKVRVIISDQVQVATYLQVVFLSPLLTLLQTLHHQLLCILTLQISRSFLLSSRLLCRPILMQHNQIVTLFRIEILQVVEVDDEYGQRLVEKRLDVIPKLVLVIPACRCTMGARAHPRQKVNIEAHSDKEAKLKKELHG